MHAFQHPHIDKINQNNTKQGFRPPVMALTAVSSKDWEPLSFSSSPYTKESSSSSFSSLS